MIMPRSIVLVSVLTILLAGPAVAEKTDWVKVTTWDGQEITLAEYGFYSCSTWDYLSDYRLDRENVVVSYGGCGQKIPLKTIRKITQDPPIFTEHFRNLEIELVDGLTFHADGLFRVTGVAGKDRVGMVHVPGRKVKSIEFIRPSRRSAGGGERE